MANVCGADDELMKQHIALLASLESKTNSNVHRLDNHEKQIEEIKNTHSILLSFDTKIKSLDEKVENQISQSKENTQTIISALLANKKTLQDRILDSVVPLMVNGALLAIAYSMFFKGVV